MSLRSRVDRIKIACPKRPRITRRSWDKFFGYYAGFPASFSDSILHQLNLPKSARVLDPWNGSGTTTFSASKIGLRSTGTDLNPVMVITARARSIAYNDVSAIVPLSKQIIAFSERSDPDARGVDPLLNWFDCATASYIRTIERAVNTFFAGRTKTKVLTAQELCTLSCIFYVILFCLGRDLSSTFKTTNPTWLIKAVDPDKRICLSRLFIHERFLSLAEQFADVLIEENFRISKSLPRLIEGDSSRLHMGKSRFDVVLTSPPYCTRLDYAAATRIELAILSPVLTLTPDALSSKMMGSIKVPVKAVTEKRIWGDECIDFLNAVKNHPSKASGTYYYKTHLDYFAKLSSSLKRISQFVSEDAIFIAVVQDSYYKDVHNDLPAIFTQMAEGHKFERLRREDFPVSQIMASRHPGVRSYTKPRIAKESVLMFAKRDDR